MRKQLIIILLVASVVLSACAKTTTPTSLPTFPAVSSTQVDVPQSSQLEAPDSGCTVVAKQPTPGPTQQSLFPLVNEDDHAKGPADARVTIIEYSDFQ